MVIFYGHLSLLEGIVWYCLIKLTTVFFHILCPVYGDAAR